MLKAADIKPTSTATAFAVGALGIALFSGMDALMKLLSIQIGTYNALLWRTLASAVIAGTLFLAMRRPWPARPALRVHLTRGLISIPMALLFFWGLARVPMAQAIALSFISPLISLYLAAALLGEKIERRALVASLLGFGGILLIFLGQAEADLGPDALAGSIAILCSAGFYAYNIVLMRRQALLAGPVEVAFFISTIMALGFATAAPVLAQLPTLSELPAIVGAACLAIGSLLLLSWAYARAEAQHLAPVEYTSFIWAAILGFLFFGESVQPWTVAGAVVIVAGCIVAARARAQPGAALEAAT